MKYIHSQYRAGGLCFPMHWHERIELLCVTNGSLLLNAGESCLEVKAGQTAVLYPYCEYDIQKESNSLDKAFGAILEYVNEHYTEKLSLEQISNRFGYNETYFCRRFKQITGFTFCNYIQILRIEKAQQLLSRTSEEIGVIAWKCGYEDISYFSNCFKKKVGYSPTEFRKMKME